VTAFETAAAVTGTLNTEPSTDVCGHRSLNNL